MKEFKASTSIEAPPEKIWAVLMNTGAWPEWDPSCERIEGRAAAGEKLKAFSS